MSVSTSGRRVVVLAGCGALAVLLFLWVRRAEFWAWYQDWAWRKIGVVVVDNCDPNYRGAGPFSDGLRFLSSSGGELFAETGLNNCEAIGSDHGVVLDPPRYRVIVRENVSGRIVARDARGRVLWSVVRGDAGAIEVDPDTGNLWCLVGHGLGQGETVVLDPNGDRIAAHPIHGFDLVYNPHGEAFWAVGTEITKFDRRGEVLLKGPKAGWAYVSVAPDPRDGSVWVAERRHSQAGGVDRVIRIDAAGSLVKEVSLDSQTAFCVACDPETGTAWIVGFRRSVLRVPVDGDPLPPLKIPARAISIGRRTGLIWVATDSEVLRLGRDGEIGVRHAFRSNSSNTWLAAP